MSTDLAGLRALAGRLGEDARTLAALGAALRPRVTGEPAPPALSPHLDAVAAALGLGDLLDRTDPAELRPLLGGIAGELFLAARLVAGAAGEGRWSGDDPAVLEAAGAVSTGFPALLRRAVAPHLDGLAERLAAPDAAFLDIGVGVGAMAIAMARQWPALHVLGVEPLPAAIALAREAVRAAGLEGRIALHEGFAQDIAQDITGQDRFDLAWVPSAFIPGEALPGVVAAAARALRPGGWLLLAFADPGESALPAALARLRIAAWGGTQATGAEIAALLGDAGLAEILRVPMPPGAPIAMAAGRRSLPPPPPLND